MATWGRERSMCKDPPSPPLSPFPPPPPSRVPLVALSPTLRAPLPALQDGEGGKGKGAWGRGLTGGGKVWTIIFLEPGFARDRHASPPSCEKTNQAGKSKPKDTLAEWLRRRPTKPMGSPRVGSNPTGVDRECLSSQTRGPCMTSAALLFLPAVSGLT